MAKKKDKISPYQSQLIKEAQSQKREYERQVKAARKRQEKEQNSIYREALKSAKHAGLYNPKSMKLTEYRKKRIRGIMETYGALIIPSGHTKPRYARDRLYNLKNTPLNRDKYFFVAIPKTKREEGLSRAKNLNMMTTPKGVFIEKEGYKKASVKYDKKHGELYIEKTGKTKKGPTAGKTYKSVTPLASMDELDNERDRLIHMAKKLTPLKKNERLVFVVRENGIEGYSHNTFGSIDLLLWKLDQYPKSVAAKINFFRHIEIQKVTSDKAWFAKHPVFSPGKQGRIAREKFYQGRNRYDESEDE